MIENRMKRETKPQYYLWVRKPLLPLTVKRVNALIGLYSIRLGELISQKGDIYTTSRIFYQLLGYFNVKHLEPPSYQNDIPLHRKKTSLPRVTTNNPRVTTAYPTKNVAFPGILGKGSVVLNVILFRMMIHHFQAKNPI